MTYANLQNVADELGRPISSFSTAETAQVNAWLRRAEATIRTRISDLEAQVGAGAIDPEILAGVEAASVARKVLNPDGKQNEKIDDYSYGRVESASTVDITITDAEWDLLIPVQQQERGAFTIRPTWG